MSEQSQTPPEAPKRAGRPPNEEKVLDALMDRPELMVKLVERMSEDPVIRAKLGITGRAETPIRRQTNPKEHMFEGALEPDALPALPDHITYLEMPSAENPEGVLNHQAIREAHAKWAQGKQLGEFGQVDENEIALAHQ